MHFASGVGFVRDPVYTYAGGHTFSGKIRHCPISVSNLYPSVHVGSTGGFEGDRHIIEPGSYAVLVGHIPVLRIALGESNVIASEVELELPTLIEVST